jgi:predicted PolB exonuclease-like 3'-5' exonuclease
MIRDYCEADTANTYLLFLRYQLLRGIFSKDVFEKEQDVLKKYLQTQNKPHWREFLKLWNDS